MTNLDRHTPTITACRFCPMCRHVCTVANATRWESTSPRGWALTCYALATGMLPAAEIAATERLFQCAGCDRCYDDCVSNYRPSAAIRAARADLVEQGLASEAVLRIQRAIADSGNPYGERSSPAVHGPTPARAAGPTVLLFRGCETRLRRPELAEAFLHICRATGVGVTELADEPCCGQPLHNLGFRNEARDSAVTLVDAIAAANAEILVFGCPSCQRQVTQVYREEYGLDLPAGLQVMHTTQFLEHLIEDGRLVVRTEGAPRVTYHDPCALGRAGMGVYDPPRAVLAALGFVIEEPRLAREHAMCCGSGTLHQTYPTIARGAAADALHHLLAGDPDHLVTACPSCKSAFRASMASDRDRVIDLVELVADLL